RLATVPRIGSAGLRLVAHRANFLAGQQFFVEFKVLSRYHNAVEVLDYLLAGVATKLFIDRRMGQPFDSGGQILGIEWSRLVAILLVADDVLRACRIEAGHWSATGHGFGDGLAERFH